MVPASTRCARILRALDLDLEANRSLEPLAVVLADLADSLAVLRDAIEAKEIANPEHEDEDSVYKYADCGFIGSDLGQVKGGTIVDNTFITDDTAEADEGKELIVQYQAKYEKDVECGGGNGKVGPRMAGACALGDPTPCNVVFGPDKCGYTKCTHPIASYKGTTVLKKTYLPYKQEDGGTSHLYRMAPKPDNTARAEIDEGKVYECSIKEDWEVLAPKEIPDPHGQEAERRMSKARSEMAVSQQVF